MPPLNILIKPASGACNMRCQYCFYADEARHRSVESYGLMQLSTLESIVKKALAYAEGSCAFGFQGGEPMLAGLDFYRQLIALEKKHNIKNISISNAIQTNGLLIDDAWAEFFHENKFLVGLSIDGGKDIHDLYRTDAAGKGTFNRVLRTVQMLNKHQVDFNALTVVTAQTARRISQIYGFFIRNGLVYQQYIPCLDPLGEERGGHPYSLSAEDYGLFLKRLFDLWYHDVKSGRFVSIRYFDNLLNMLLGYPPESCGLAGQCSVQNVVEADGSVYPCDFYMLDSYRLGNLNTDGFSEINRKRDEIGFLADSRKVEPECLACDLGWICHGGCRRDRQNDPDGGLARNHFCAAYKEFFPYALPRLNELCRIRQGRGTGS